ncbi:hypothetical protein TrCOL_g5405 [Triparma columacea]|uniref:Uncharacterized protein n=1 Tax=Triparma columacea TaxID=722753 RepID=A0A9W7GCK0_9STRA|nr:hypothetical protein TrCOL_g5405 [Triparma columacea]
MPDYESPSGLSDSANASASFDKARIEEALETGLANNTSMASRGAIKKKRVASDYESDDGMQEEENQLHNLHFLDKSNVSYSSLGNVIQSSMEQEREGEGKAEAGAQNNDDSVLSYETYNLSVDQAVPVEAASPPSSSPSSSSPPSSPPTSPPTSPNASPFPQNIHTSSGSRRQSAPEAIKQLAAVLHMDIDLDGEGFDVVDDDNEGGADCGVHGTIDFDRASNSSDGDMLGGSSITASELAENQLISGWNELERLDKSIEGESVTIRVKVREGAETDKTDDSIQLDPQSYKDLADLLRRAELSHKLSREVIDKQSPASSRRASTDTPVSDCGSADTPIRSPRNMKSTKREKKIYEDDWDMEEEFEEDPRASSRKIKFSSIHSAHAQELLMFLKGKTSAPPGAVSVSDNSSTASSLMMHNSPTRELRIEMKGLGGVVERETNSASVSPPHSAASTVVDDDLEVMEAVGSGRKNLVEKSSSGNELVVVESKKTKRNRLRKEKEKLAGVKSVKFDEGVHDMASSGKEEVIKAPAKPIATKFTKVGEMVIDRNPYGDLEGPESAFVPVEREEEAAIVSGNGSDGGSIKKGNKKRSTPTPKKSKKGSSGKKKARGGSAVKAKVEDNYDDVFVKTSLVTKYKTKIIGLAMLLLATLGLYVGGFHESAAGDAGVVRGRGEAGDILVDILYPAPGKIMASKQDVVSFKMDGAAIVPGEMMDLEILLDGSLHLTSQIVIPNDASNGHLDGSLSLDSMKIGPEVFGAGSHNVTIACRTGDKEGVGTSVFLYMPKEGEEATGGVEVGRMASEESGRGAEMREGDRELVEFDKATVKVEISQPERHSVVNGDTLVIKFNTEGFAMGGKEVKVVMVLDGNSEHELAMDVNTIGNLARGKHSMKLYAIFKETMEVLWTDEVNWENVEVSEEEVGVVEGEKEDEQKAEEVPILVDGTPLHDLSNAKLIEITGAAGLTSSIRGRLLEELELRFEQFQKLYAMEKAAEGPEFEVSKGNMEIEVEI